MRSDYLKFKDCLLVLMIPATQLKLQLNLCLLYTVDSNGHNQLAALVFFEQQEGLTRGLLEFKQYVQSLPRFVLMQRQQISNSLVAFKNTFG
jgi:hypothetical protein